MHHTIATIISNSEKTIALANEHGVQCQIVISHECGTNIETRNLQLEQLEDFDEYAVAVTVISDGRHSVSHSNQIDADTLHSLLLQTIRQAELNQADHHYALPELTYLAKQRDIHNNSFDLYHPASLSTSQAIDYCNQLERTATNVDNRISVEQCTFSQSNESTMIFNSHGWAQQTQQTQYSASCAVIAASAGKKQIAYDYVTHHDVTKMPFSSAIATNAAHKALDKLQPHTITSGTYPVLLHADVAQMVWRQLLSACHGKHLFKQSSFLIDKIGKQIFPPWLQVHEQCHQRGISGSAWYDQDGIATQDKTIIENGILKQFLFNIVYARKCNTKPTGNGGYIGVISIESDHITNFDALVEQCHTGFLCTDIMGQGANTLTGDISFGASGKWISAGKITHAVEEITLAANLIDIFAGIQAHGNDIDTRSSIHTGSILIHGFTIGA